MSLMFFIVKSFTSLYVPSKLKQYVIINQEINNEGHNNSLNKSADIGSIDVDFIPAIVKSL